MTTIHQRTDWTKRLFRSRVALRFSDVKHVVIHWPGSKGHLLLAKVAGYLRGWQDWHMDGRGWTDIAYNEAVDQNGDVWILRGDYRDGATKNYGGRSYSILAVLGTDDTPSDAMLATLADRANAAQARSAAGCRIVGHRDLITTTECPGDALYGWIHAGMPLAEEPAPTDPDEVDEPTDDNVPPYPLPKGYYYGPKDGPVRSVSGYYSTRSNGKRGDDGLALAQQHGADLGLYTGVVDGLYGPKTRHLAEVVQTRACLHVDGLLGSDTWPQLWQLT